MSESNNSTGRLPKNRMSTKFSYILKPSLILPILSGVALGSLVFFSVYIAVYATVGLVILVLVSNSPIKALSILILLLPFTGTVIFEEPLVGIPGGKLLNLLGLFVILISLINHKKVQKPPFYPLLFAVLFIGMFGLSILRSLPHLDAINFLREDKLSVIRYILSDFIKPLIYFSPFIVTILFLEKSSELSFLTSMLAWSLTLLSIYLTYLCLFRIPDITDVNEASQYYLLTFGMHRNDLANFYILGFPLVLGRFFLKRSVFTITSLILVIIAIGFLYSRTAYFTVTVSFILYLLLSKRTKVFPILLVVAFGFSSIISTVIVERASKGLKSGDWDEIFAGRVQGIWVPLVEEYGKSPAKLLFGNGRYAILSSDSATRGIILETVEHPHNMYLEQILDVGIFGLILIIAFFAFLLKRCYVCLRRSNNSEMKEYYSAFLVSLLCYFAGGLTGRSLFPTLTNSYFWFIAGITIALNRSSETLGENTDSEEMLIGIR